jgi:WD40 repeat protein
MKKHFLILFTLSWFSFLHSQDFQLIDTWKKNESAIECITLTPDGEKILVGHHDGSLAMWDINKKMMVAEYHSHIRQLNTIIFNQSNTRFVTAGIDSRVVLWEYPSMKVVRIFKTTQDVNNFAVLTPDENWIYFGGSNSSSDYRSEAPYAALYRLNVKTGAEEVAFNPQKLSKEITNLTDGDLDVSGKYIVVTKERKLIFYDVLAKKYSKYVQYDYNLNNLTFYKNLLYLWGDKMLMKLEDHDGKYEVTHTVLAGTHDSYGGYSEMEVSANGKFLVTGDDDNNVNIWDTESMIKKQILFGHTDVVRAFVFCKNDTVLITGGYDGQLLVWSYRKKKEEDVKEDDKPEDVVFAENNIPLTILDRGVDLQTNLLVKESEFDIQIWDKAVEDGDSISLNLNGEWILRDHLVTRAKMKVHVKLNTLFTNNYLILYAHNLGSIPPNTAAVAVLIGGKEVVLSITSDMKKSGALNFEYKP